MMASADPTVFVVSAAPRVATLHPSFTALQSSAPVHAQGGQSRILSASLVAGSAAAAAALIGRRRGRTAPKAQRTRGARAALAECPPTVWGTKNIDVSAKSEVKPMPLEVPVPGDVAGDLKAQEQYFLENRANIHQQLRDHGAVVFRSFELMKETEGFQKFYEALKLEPCLDPLHSVAARPTVSSTVYEAVNKESRKNFYVGMHNEMVGNRAPGAAAFVCFKPAEQGGEFLLLDGRKMVSELDKSFLKRLYNREIRYSTAEFPMGFLDSPPLAWAKDILMPAVESVMRFAVSMKVDFDTELVWSVSDYDQSRILQVRAQPQPPVIRHPFTQQPVWFFNVHSHSAYLREEREKVYGSEGLESTEGSSRINRTDVYYGDNGEKFSAEDLKYLDQVIMKNLVPVKMQKGDVVLLDNYMVMHGRNIFDGTRKHAVSWFKLPNYAEFA